MWRRLFVGLIVLTVIFAALNLRRNSTRDAVLAQAGPVDDDAPREFITTPSGLRYRILRKGDGPNPQLTDTITVNYAGWLDNEIEFDNSYGEKPLVVPLTHVVQGWIEGLPLLGEGGMIELEVPSELGYGSESRGTDVPPDSTLHFIVELLDVEPVDRPPEAGPRDSDAPQEFTTTETGLKYRVLRRGDGSKPTATDTVVIHYKGWLDDGTVFDKTYKHNTPATVRLSEGVIPGWTEGLTYVGKGGMIELEVPTELGYGSEWATGIPPNSTLHFLVEILDVE